MRRMELLSRSSGMAVTALAAGLIAMVGCDKSPSPPAVSATPPPTTAPAEPRPTTQELLTGTYHPMSLPGMPLSVQVPASWKLDTKSPPLTFLAGPTPSSDMSMIQLSQNGTVKPEQIDVIATGAKKAPNGEQIKNADLRDAGKMKVLERVAVGKPETIPKVDVKGNPVVDEKTGQTMMVTTTPVKWQVTAFVPYQNMYTRYDLSVVDLTTDQYEQDKRLFEKIFESLRAEGDVSAGSAAPPTTAGSM